MENNNLADEEIDLYELYLVLKKRFFIIVLFVIVGICAGFAYIFLSKPVYSSSFYVVVNNQNNQNNQNQIDANMISNIINTEFSNKAQNIEMMAKLLNLSYSQAEQIAAIKAENTPNQGLKITIESYRPKEIEYITSGLINYLNSQPYIKSIIGPQKHLLELQKKLLKESLQNQIELKNKITSEITKGKVNIIGFNPLDLDKSILKTKVEIQDIDREINILGVKILSKEHIPSKPSKPKKLLILAVSFLSSLFLGIFFAFFAEWISTNKKRAKNN
jgi:capsular polysaccharide biosynthesis protein